jgi:hypothetical protein
MYRSVQQALRVVFENLSPTLVPEATRTRLLQFAARHPGLGQTQYLECRLGQRAPSQIDLLISAATTFERTSLRRLLAARAREVPEFWPIHRFVEAWESPGSVLNRSVPVAWLEFDHMEQDDNPVANVGVCLVPAYLDPFADLPPQSEPEMMETIVESLRVIRDDEPSAEETVCFQRCLDQLPERARWIHLSVMAARAPMELKLYGTFPVKTVVPFLRDIGWAGDREAVAELLARYCPSERTADVVYLDLPVTGMLTRATAGVGIVFAQQHLRVAGERDPARRELLDVLVADGLCSARERDDLIGWPGHDLHSPMSGAGAPPMRVDRWFDIKLAHRPGAPLLAKVYLGFVARDVAMPAVTMPATPGYPPAEASSDPCPAPGTI